MISIEAAILFLCVIVGLFSTGRAKGLINKGFAGKEKIWHLVVIACIVIGAIIIALSSNPGSSPTVLSLSDMLIIMAITVIPFGTGYFSVPRKN